MPLSKE